MYKLTDFNISKPLLIANDDKGHPHFGFYCQDKHDDKGHPVHGVVDGVHLPESRLNGRSDRLGESQFYFLGVRWVRVNFIATF